MVFGFLSSLEDKSVSLVA